MHYVLVAAARARTQRLKETATKGKPSVIVRLPLWREILAGPSSRDEDGGSRDARDAKSSPVGQGARGAALPEALRETAEHGAHIHRQPVTFSVARAVAPTVRGERVNPWTHHRGLTRAAPPHHS